MTKTLFSRSGRIALAALLLLSSLVPLLVQHKVGAYGQVTSREIKISSSVVSSTSTKYDVKFTAGTTGTVKSLVVDFCSNSPIVGDSCTAPTGFTLTGSPTVTLISGITATYTASTLNSNRTLTLTKAAGDSLTGGSTVVEFEINTVTNPSTLGTFYARIFTYPNDTTSNYAGGYTPATVGTGSDVPTDTGGIALSTSAQINVTSKVQERLTFCVYTTGAGNDCTSKSGTAVLLGDTNGVLDPAGAYVDVNAKYTITTNATGNAIIRMKGSTLTSGANTIASTNTGATSTPGSPQFGVCTYQSAGSGMTPNAPYNDALCSGTTQSAGTGTPGGDNGSSFAFETANTGSTYGDDIATKPAGAYSTGILAFLGNISNTTPAGIYTTALTFIATGTY